MAITLKELIEKLNGIRSVGFAELADSGLPAKDWFAVPQAVFTKPTLKTIVDSDMAKAYLTAVSKVEKLDAKYPKPATDAMTAAINGNILTFKDKGSIEVTQKAWTEAQARIIVNSLLTYYAPLEKADRLLKASFNFISLANGWTQFSTNDEAVMIENSDADHADIGDFLLFLSQHANEIISLCASGAISHWLTNHTIGAMAGNNIVAKTWGFTTLKNERTEKSVALNKLLYLCVHPISKRNALYTIESGILGFDAVYTYGFRIPERYEVDKAFFIRMTGLPAGNRRLEIALSLIKEMKRFKTAVCADAFRFIDKVVEKYIQARKNGISSHIGAKYYSRFSPKECSYIDLVDADINNVIRAYGSILTVIDPDSTLANSPIIKSVLASGRDVLAEANCKALLKAYADSRAEIMTKVLDELKDSKFSSIEAIDGQIEKAISVVDEFIAEATKKKAITVEQPEELKK